MLCKPTKTCFCRGWAWYRWWPCLARWAYIQIESLFPLALTTHTWASVEPIDRTQFLDISVGMSTRFSFVRAQYTHLHRIQSSRGRLGVGIPTNSICWLHGWSPMHERERWQPPADITAVVVKPKTQTTLPIARRKKPEALSSPTTRYGNVCPTALGIPMTFRVCSRLDDTSSYWWQWRLCCGGLLRLSIIWHSNSCLVLLCWLKRVTIRRWQGAKLEK